MDTCTADSTDIIQTRCAKVLAYDPATPNTLVNEEERAGGILDDLTDEAVADVMQIHGLPPTELNNVTIWARDRVRAQLFTSLANIVIKAENDRTDDEQSLYDWLTNVVWQKRIDAAQAAWDQHRAWDQSRGTCTYHEPNDTGYLGFNEFGLLENKNACVTNGGACFSDLEPFEYGTCDLNLCGPGPYLQQCVLFNFIPVHPSYPDFKAYGAAIAHKVYAEEPNALSILTGTGKGMAIGIGIGAVVVVGVIIAVLVPGIAAGFGAAVFPFAGIVVGGISAFAAGAIAIIGSILIVVLAIIIIIVGVIQLVEFGQIPLCLKEDIKIAAGVNVSPRQCAESSQQGKPNLATLITTENGKQEIFLAFVAATLPEPNNSATAPAPQTAPFWAVRNESGIPLLDESGPLLDLTSWSDPEGNPTFVQAGLYNGWFVAKFPLENGGTINILTLGIEYVTPSGEKWTAWRSKCGEDATTEPCSPGQAIFIHTRNGDEPPTGQSADDFAAWFANVSMDLTYKDGNGNPRIASLHTAPIVSGFMSDGTLEEGSQLSLTASSTPSGATLAWDFADGTTGSGSPVLHTFNDNGTFNLQVTATDLFGSIGEATIFPLTITNVAPTATFTATAQVVRGESATLALTTPFDPSPVDTAAGFQHSFDCTNDGTPEVSGSSTPAYACHYPTAGTFTARGVIADKDLGSTPYTAQVTVVALQQAAETLRTQLLDLREQRVLKKKELNILLNDRLKYTIERLDTLVETAKGREAATTALREFLSNVTVFVSQGILTAAQGQALSEVATRLLAVVASFAGN